MEHMIGTNVLFIGYSNGLLEFKDKEGFSEKGKAEVHKSPIRSIKQLGDLLIVADESGLLTTWKVLDEKTAEFNKNNYNNKKQGFVAGTNPLGGSFNQQIGLSTESAMEYN